MKGSLRLARHFFLLFLMIAAFHISLPMSFAAGAEAAAAFEIRAFELSGNSIFPGGKAAGSRQDLHRRRENCGGRGKGRDALEKLYHDAGYPAVLVNIT